MRNKSKGLDLIETVPEELWLEVCDTVQEAVIKTISQKKKCKKAKWLSEEALQIVVKRSKVKGKGEKERYQELNCHLKATLARELILGLLPVKSSIHCLLPPYTKMQSPSALKITLQEELW